METTTNICHHHQCPESECGCSNARKCPTCGLTLQCSLQYFDGYSCPECEFQNAIKMNLLDCGIHSSASKLAGSPCLKCQHNARQMANKNFRAGLQYGRTPWNAVITPSND